MNDLDVNVQEESILDDTFVPSPHEKPIRAAFDPMKQPNWANHGFILVNGAWRDSSRYKKEKKEEEVAASLAARGIYPETEVDEPYLPPPGHVTYTRDELKSKGLTMMEYMRQLDEQNRLKRLERGMGLSPIIPKN